MRIHYYWSSHSARVSAHPHNFSYLQPSTCNTPHAKHQPSGPFDKRCQAGRSCAGLPSGHTTFGIFVHGTLPCFKPSRRPLEPTAINRRHAVASKPRLALCCAQPPHLSHATQPPTRSNAWDASISFTHDGIDSFRLPSKVRRLSANVVPTTGRPSRQRNHAHSTVLLRPAIAARLALAYSRASRRSRAQLTISCCLSSASTISASTISASASFLLSCFFVGAGYGGGAGKDPLENNPRTCRSPPYRFATCLCVPGLQGL